MNSPSNWQEPKVDWRSGDPVGAADFNRIEKNIGAIETGERALDQAQVPNSNIGTLRQILNWLINRIKAILGTANWYDAPPVTLKATADKLNDIDGHVKIKKNVIIAAVGWVDDTANSGYWKYDIVDADITADSVIDVNVHLEYLEKAEDIKSACLSTEGKVTLYSEWAITEDVIADLKIVRQVG